MENDRGIEITEGRDSFFVLLDVFAHIDREPWYSRGPCRDPVAAIFGWATTHAGTIDVSA